MNMMSITEAIELAKQRRPVYNTKPVDIYTGPEIVANPNPTPIGTVSPGYLGQVYGYATEMGKIYLKIDDTNVYNDGIWFYVLADKDAIVTNEADAPVVTPGIFEKFTDAISNTVSNAASYTGKKLLNVGLVALGLFVAYKIFTNTASDEIKSGAKKIAGKTKTAIDKGVKKIKTVSI